MDQNPPAAPQNTKQQVVDVLKNATNVLVTVSANPSVDQLASCIGLTLMMNKLEKHCTAVFSGTVPSTLEFLKPEKTLEQNTDSLRDFIISLDRNKADKLRYKIEDNIVKIFITPYRTSLSEADLQYSQGDYNVDVVVALGVDKREHLDQAITAHGKILHDATVVGVSCGTIPTVVGSINWHDPSSSSLSEMLVSISEAFQSGIVDTQMATAFLTGIVAQTERFSNDKTSPKVMTMSAQLMAAGANQQLIATQLNTKPAPVAVAVNQEAEKSAEFSVPHTEPPSVIKEPPISVKSEAFAPENTADNLDQKETLESSDLVSPAPAVEVGDINNPEDELSQIDIDRAGHLHDVSPTGQLEEETKRAKTENQVSQLKRNREKVIEPLSSDLGGKPSSNYIFEPPANGGTFTASANDDAEAEISNANSDSPNETPILTHDHSADNNIPSPSTEDSARQAVINAVSSADYKPLADKPDEALNAQPIDLGAGQNPPISTANAVDPNVVPPPIVPPPITPLPNQPSTPSDPTDITMPTPGV